MGYEMKAFHDTKAAPVATMCVSASSALPEYMPKLAEEGGLGTYVKNDGAGWHTYENGSMFIEKERRTS